MKIALISPNPTHLTEIGQVLEAAGHTVARAQGGKSRMRSLAQEQAPELMLVDGMCCDVAELEQIEQVTAEHPALAVVLLCALQTPEFLISAMRAGVREVLPSPPTPAALHALVARIAAKQRGARPAAAGRLLAVMPGKGGSGATFVACNLARQLAESRSVLLMDLNLQFGDALSLLHDGRPSATLADVARDINRLDATLLAASCVPITPNLRVLAAPEDLAQSVEIQPEQIDAILALALRHYDFVLMDLSRHLDPLTLRAMDQAERLLVVVQAALPWMRQAAQLQAVFKSLGYPAGKVEWVVNRYEKSGDISLSEVCRSLGVARVHTIANAYKDVKASVNYGTPLIDSARGSTVTRNLADLALSLSPQPADTGRGLLARLFKSA